MLFWARKCYSYIQKHCADAGVLTPGEDCHDDPKTLTKEKVSSRNSSESSGDEDRDKRNTSCMTKQVAPVVKMARRVS